MDRLCKRHAAGIRSSVSVSKEYAQIVFVLTAADSIQSSYTTCCANVYVCLYILVSFLNEKKRPGNKTTIKIYEVP